jgi:DNA-binding response OmpR family regulator
VLVVDDDPDMAGYLALLLKRPDTYYGARDDD